MKLDPWPTHDAEIGQLARNLQLQDRIFARVERLQAINKCTALNFRRINKHLNQYKKLS